VEVGIVDLGDLVVCELQDPAGVIQRLSDDLARRLVALDLDHDEVAVGVDREKVDLLSVAGRHLSADQQEVAVDQADVVLDGLLEMRFLGQVGRLELGCSLVDAPDSEL